MDNAESFPPLQSCHVTERPIFALVIGINDYQDGSPTSLRGCVQDSKAVFDYLKDTLRVSETNIVLLHNEQATREKIISTFESHFINNSAIKKGDAIIFYFAGHGSRQKAPDGWYSEDNRVEMICPYDFMRTSGIPDYTFTHLFRQLTCHKGNNITVILDSCHSGGMARAKMETIDDEIPLIRCYDPPDNLPPFLVDLDRRIWSWNPKLDHELEDGRVDDLQEPEVHASHYNIMETHVLLAACQPNQRARETQICGVWSGAFTTVLINSLKAWDPSAHSLTYSRLMEHLSPLNDQHPHCEGDNKVRRLFSPSDVGRDDPSYFVVTAAEAVDTYYVAVGDLLGIVEGTEFITHPANGYDPIILKVIDVEKFRCKAVPCRKEKTPGDPDSQPPSASILPQHSRATILKWATRWLTVELDPREEFLHITENDDALFSIVESGGELKVSRADSGSNTVQLVRNDPLIRSQPECHRISINFDTLTRQHLDNAARFNFFLYQRNKFYRRPAISVTASLQLLERAPSLVGPKTLKPVGDNLFHAPHASGSREELAGVAVLEGPATNFRYGLTLKNLTPTDLFVYVFFFDPGKYDITGLYLPLSTTSRPLTSRDTDGSTLGIGYTSKAKHMNGFEFNIPEGVNHDSAFFKIFVSTNYINMEAILMKSDRATQPFTPELNKRSWWDSWIYLVTVRR